MNLLVVLYRQDRRGFVHDFFIGLFLVFALGVGAAVVLVILDWALNG